MIKTRFAPSPTGELHIGSARTALFSYLFAKNQKGEFLLRIEDTDRERFIEGSDKKIIESLKWLNIEAENIDKPVIQSDRLEVYKKAAFDLVNAGKAYICTCSKEELAREREEQVKRGEAPRYNGHCRDKIQDTRNKIQTNINNQIPDGAVVRMKMPQEGKIVVDDLIHGKVEFDSALQDDQIILKSDGYPTYHLASVIDDNEMEITHVIRSDEWLPSTPKHIELYKMFGFKAPFFAHLPMILGPDKKKLSKRHGATSILQYREEGYLPEALVNFIAFLGWNPKDEREIFSMDELISEFSLEKVNKSPAIFDIEKLNSINENYLRTEEPKNLRTLVEKYGADNLTDGEIELIGRGGYRNFKEAAEYINKLRKDPEYEASLLIFKKSDRDKTARGLEETRNKLSDLGSGLGRDGQETNNWDTDNLQNALEKVVADNQLSNGDVFWPVRVALSGEEKSPSPVELAVALEKEETLKRIGSAIKKLE